MRIDKNRRKESFVYVVKGCIYDGSREEAMDRLELLFQGAGISVSCIDVGNLSGYYPVRNEK
jgi:hypothetical protein